MKKLTHITEAELSLLSPRLVLPLIDWAQRHLRVVDGPFVTGSDFVPFDSSRFPLQRDIMRAIDDARWREVVVVGPTQVGKSQSGVIAPILHRLFEQRQSVVFMHSSSDLAQAFYDTKILPAIKANDRLKAELPKRRDDQGKGGLRRFSNGTFLWLVGSESTGALSSLSAPVVVCDDIQEMPPRLGHRGHPCDLVTRRQSSFSDSQRTTVFLGTAGSDADFHWHKLRQSTFYRPYVPCSRCGTYQLILWEQLRFPEGDLIRSATEATHECSACKFLIPFSDLASMLQDVQWVSTAGMEQPAKTVDIKTAICYPHTDLKTRTCGFWFNGLYWPAVHWGTRVAEGVEARSNPDKQMSFNQNVLTIPLASVKSGDVAPVTLDSLRLLKLPQQRWSLIPKNSGVLNNETLLVATVDPGGGFIWYDVWLWNVRTGESWQIEFGRMGTRTQGEIDVDDAKLDKQREQEIVASLHNFHQKTLIGWAVDGTGELIKASCVLVDRGYKPHLVDEFCRNCKGWLSVTGSERKAHRSSIWPGHGKFKTVVTSSGEGRYWEVNVNAAKMVLRSKLQYTDNSTPHHIAGDIKDSMLETLQKHILAERWDEGNQVWVRMSRNNHFFDTGCLQIVAAVANGIPLVDAAFMKPAETKKQITSVQQPAVASKPVKRSNFRPFRRNY